MKGVWDGLDKERIGRAVVTAFNANDYMELLAQINNAENLADIEAARGRIKDVMGLWREECPEYAFMVDCLYLFSERMIQALDQHAASHGQPE